MLRILNRIVQRVQTVVSYVLVHYVDFASGNTVKTIRERMGDLLTSLSIDTEIDDDGINYYVYKNLRTQTGDPLPLLTPPNGDTYYCDILSIYIPIESAVVSIIDGVQNTLAFIDIISNCDVSFAVMDVENISFQIYVNNQSIMPNGMKKYQCYFRVNNLVSSPGQTFLYQPMLIVNQDTVTVLEAPIHFKVIHESASIPD